jgi:hypothetical protein
VEELFIIKNKPRYIVSSALFIKYRAKQATGAHSSAENTVPPSSQPLFLYSLYFFLRNSFSAAYNPNAIKIGFFHYDTGIEGKEQRFKVSFLAVIPSSLWLSSRRILSAAESLRERIINKVVCVCAAPLLQSFLFLMKK